ncbi:hypothetical protein C7B82_04330 [Stenomitos frigidus ULC18]|uniref:Nucleoside phosphorylase domain-containing protein n=1 Tax=Stenomitos frigidus ULC18 TaxID=2107698 RepID=A0A2T1EM19_9CYAN|nr:hypothetical protein C7B82_04330 [Stenomitos frigidus ULC18]
MPSVVILTALQVEYLAVRAHLNEWNEEIYRDTIYERGRFIANGQVWDVVIVEIGMGNDGAAAEAVRAIDRFNPDVMLFVGVAGGIKDVALGDVVAATKVYGYEYGRAEEQFLPRPELGEGAYKLVNRARAEARKTDWLRRVQSSVAGSKPRVHAAPIAAGEKVITSTRSPIFGFLRQQYSDAIAVEMEGFGVLKAARMDQRVAAIVIRGISDLIDRKEEMDTAGFKEIAARHASAFAFEVLAKLWGGGIASPVPDTSQSGTEAIAVHIDETIQIPLERQFPKDVAILYVEEREGKLALKAFNAEQDSLEPLKDCPPPPLLPDELKSSQQISDFLGTLVAYRPRKCAMGQFLGWLLTLRRTLRETANLELSRLIINDRTGFEIPWEMLNLPGNETLGTVVQMVRWHDVDDPDTWELMPLPLPTLKKHSCQGKILVHAGVGYNTESHKPFQVLRSYQTVHLPDLQTFFNRLQQAQSEFGLLFIASREFQCLSKETLKAYLHYTDAMRSNSIVVFIDAQLFLDGQPSMSYREIAVSFLEGGLKGVIGSLKTLNDPEANQIVQHFFAELDRDRTATIPEILRRLRVKANQRLRQAFNQENCLLYLSTCLYAYYGNQMTVLELTPTEDTTHD